MYRCCRWCNNFDSSSGICTSGAIKNAEINLDKLTEDGTIVDSLLEGYALDDTELKEIFELAKDLKISKVKAEKLIDKMQDLISSKRYDVEDTVFTAVVNNASAVNGVYIEDEHEYVCSEFK